MIKRIPTPINGLILGLFALGNLLQGYHNSLRIICGILGGILLLLFLIKTISYPKMIKEDLQNPVVASVAGTLPMAIMLLSVYLKPLLGAASIILWYLGILLHLLLILYFTTRFILKVEIPKVFASYFVVYVGIVVASLTSPAYDMQWIGQIFFWVGFIGFIFLLGLVTYRYVKYKEVPDPAKPIICIYAAPAALLVAGYIQSFAEKSLPFLIALYAVALLLYLFVIIRGIIYTKLPFYPSFSAFTFPFVISAIATRQMFVATTAMGYSLGFLDILAHVQMVIAVLAVLFTLFKYVQFLSKSPKNS